MGDYFPPWLDQLVTDARGVLADWDETVAQRLSERIDEEVSAPLLQGDPARVSRGLILLSAVKKRQGDLSGYVRTLRRAIGVADTEKGEDREYVRTVAGTALVGVLEDLAEWAEADRLRSATLESARRLTGRNRRLLCVCLGTFGLGYSSQGDFAKSELLFAEAVEVAREEPVDQSMLAATIDALAAHYDSTGAARRAERLRLEALSLHRQSGVTERLIDSLITLAEMRWNANDRVGAESLLEEAEAGARELMHGDRGPRPQLLRRLAHARRTVRAVDDEQYVGHLQQALDLSRTSVGSPAIAASLTLDLAGLRLAQGRLDEADCLGQEVLATQRATGHASQELRSALILCARTKRLRGHASAAESLAREALFGDDPGVHRPQALRELALSLTGLHRYGESLAALQEAAVLDDQRAGQLFTSRSPAELLEYVRVLRMTTGQMISLALDYEPAAEEAFRALLRRKSLSAFAALTRRQAVLSHGDPHLRDAYARLTATNLDIARHELIPRRRGVAGGARLESRLDALRERALQLEAEVATRVPEADVLIDPFGGAREIAATLGRDEALVEFARFGHVVMSELRPRAQRYVAFIVRGGDATRMTMLDLGPAGEIDEAVESFRARVLSQQPAERHSRSKKQSEDLIGQLLIEPLLSCLGEVRHLLIAPDGQLARLPFAALPVGDKAQLVDRYSVVYVSTGRDLLRRPRGSPPLPTAPLVVADPEFDATPDALEVAAIADKDERGHPQDSALKRAIGRFPRLPGTAEEGSVVADMLHVSAVTGRQASKGLVLEARSPRVLHIATHGFSLEKDSDESADPALWSLVEDFAHRASLENPLLRCGLAMAGANSYLARRDSGAALDDGIVNGEDISSLDLRGTELVVLSACETGLGKIQAGEGVLGLVRAFLLAGAKSVLATLWPIPDLATRVLIEHFYRARALSSTSAEALAIAQLATRSTHPEPVNWAGFVCFEAYRGQLPSQLSGPSDRS